MHLEKFQLDQIQNGRLSAIIHLDRPDIADIMKTAQDSYTITMKQIVGFQERCILKNFNLIKFKMAAYRPLFTSTGLILGETC